MFSGIFRGNARSRVVAAYSDPVRTHWSRRARSAGTLVVLVTGLGVAAAAAIGGMVLLIALIIRQTIG